MAKRINYQNSYSTKKWFNYVVTFFFFENGKKLGRSDDAKRRKKIEWPQRKKKGRKISIVGRQSFNKRRNLIGHNSFQTSIKMFIFYMLFPMMSKNWILDLSSDLGKGQRVVVQHDASGKSQLSSKALKLAQRKRF